MTGAHECQPEAAPPYQHVCPDVDCCYYGQPSFRGCGCYRTREQMMQARIEELTKALRDVLDSEALTTMEGCTCESCAPIARARALVPSLEQSGSGK